LGLIFRTKNNRPIPIETGGLSQGIVKSSIGAPARIGERRAVPQTARAPDRLLKFAAEQKEKAIASKRETEASKKAQNQEIIKFEAEQAKKTTIQQNNEVVDSLKETLDTVRGKKEKAQEKRDEIKETIETLELQSETIKGLPLEQKEQALKFLAFVKGDKDAKAALDLIQKQKIAALNKRINKENDEAAQLIADNTKLEAESSQQILVAAGGQLNPQTDTYSFDPEKTEKNLKVKLDPQQKEELKQTEIKAPPELNRAEVLTLIKHSAGRAKLREWGYIK